VSDRVRQPVPTADAALPTALPIELDRATATPLAVQLADRLRAAAAEGHLRSGDRLPSTRALATRLAVSRTVTAAAYEQLHAEGWITGRHGSGTYVTTEPPRATSPRRRTTEPVEPHRVDLVPGAPWVDGLDRAAWRRAWRAAADAPPLLRPQRGGLPEYRSSVAEHLLRHRGLVLSSGFVEQDLLATAGTTAAVTELAIAVLRPGDVVAVEEPGYQRAVQAFRAAGMRVVAAPVDPNGLAVDSVPAGVRAVYCSPSHQYPLGGRMAAANRVALVERARAEGWLVIEDDYDGELRYDVAPLPLLVGLAPDVVVHLGTTSKIFTSTLGIGWMVAPPEVASTVLAHRERTGTGPSAAGQRVLVELARHGDLGRHLRRLRRELSARRELVVGALDEADLAVLGDDAGAHVVVPLPSAAAERRVVEQARTAGITLDGLARHHDAKPTWHGIAVGYTACTRPELLTALPVVVHLLREAAAQRGRVDGGGLG
jgi:GntR family transcriptional regulator / MocR family aminotransferase